MSYTNPFGGSTIPPSDYSYREIALTTNTTVDWAFNSTGPDILADINDLNPQSASLSLTLPAANLVSTGESLLFKNIGVYSVDFKDNDGNGLGSIAAGETKYLYISNNSSTAGTWRIFTFGTGTSTAEALDLAGSGLIVLGAELALAYPISTTISDLSVVKADRAKAFVFTGGAVTVSLLAALTAGGGFFFMVNNSGTGTVTIDPNSTETIDGATTKSINPGESAIIICSGSAWYTVGYGRSSTFQFTQLVKDVSAGGSFTLTTVEAGNKLLKFIGTPASNVTINLPALVNVFYVQCAYSGGNTLTIKTAAGTGPTVSGSDRIIVYCDGVDVVMAQTVTVSSQLSLIDGTASSPAMAFASDPDTGLYRSAANELSVATGGAQLFKFTATGLVGVPSGAGVSFLGSLGVGTVSPQAKFALLDAGSTQFLQKTVAGANDLLVWDSYNASAVKAIYVWRTEGTELMRLNNLGSLGIGSSSLTGWSLRIEKSITGSTAAIGCGVASTVLSDVTSDARYFRTSAATQAAAFTLTTLTHFYASQSTIGAGSTVTNQYGFQVENNLTGATNNFGFYSGIASGSNRWNFYANGTAANAFAGVTTFGAKMGYGTFSGAGGTVTQLTSKATGVTLNTPSGQITMNNAALAANTIVSFTLTNSSIAANDTPVCNRKSGGTALAYNVWVDSVAAGSCVIAVQNITAGSLSEAIVLQFNVVAGATS